MRVVCVEISDEAYDEIEKYVECFDYSFDFMISLFGLYLRYLNKFNNDGKCIYNQLVTFDQFITIYDSLGNDLVFCK